MFFDTRHAEAVDGHELNSICKYIQTNNKIEQMLMTNLRRLGNKRDQVSMEKSFPEWQKQLDIMRHTRSDKLKAWHYELVHNAPTDINSDDVAFTVMCVDKVLHFKTTRGE